METNKQRIVSFFTFFSWKVVQSAPAKTANDRTKAFWLIFEGYVLISFPLFLS